MSDKQTSLQLKKALVLAKALLKKEAWLPLAITGNVDEMDLEERPSSTLGSKIKEGMKISPLEKIRTTAPLSKQLAIKSHLGEFVGYPSKHVRSDALQAVAQLPVTAYTPKLLPSSNDPSYVNKIIDAIKTSPSDTFYLFILPANLHAIPAPAIDSDERGAYDDDLVNQRKVVKYWSKAMALACKSILVYKATLLLKCINFFPYVIAFPCLLTSRIHGLAEETIPQNRACLQVPPGCSTLFDVPKEQLLESENIHQPNYPTIVCIAQQPTGPILVNRIHDYVTPKNVEARAHGLFAYMSGFIVLDHTAIRYPLKCYLFPSNNPNEAFIPLCKSDFKSKPEKRRVDQVEVEGANIENRDQEQHMELNEVGGAEGLRSSTRQRNGRV